MKKQRHKVTDSDLVTAVKNSSSVMGVLRFLGIREAGGSHSHYSRRIAKLNLDTSHFTGSAWNKGTKHLAARRHAKSILIKRESGRRENAKLLRRALMESGVTYECATCKQPPIWQGSPLTLDVDHINGDWLDDRQENLQFLCPNCHTQLSRNLVGR